MQFTPVKKLLIIWTIVAYSENNFSLLLNLSKDFCSLREIGILFQTFAFMNSKLLDGWIYGWMDGWMDRATFYSTDSNI